MCEGITTLPTEIIEEIISYTSYSDIAALAQTCQRLYQVVGPRRVRSVIPLLTAKRMRRCIQRLAGDPQRASLILEIHITKLMRRHKPSRWCFGFIANFFIAALDGVFLLPFVPVEPYPELRHIFNDALCNMTHLRTLSVHSAQHDGIWNDIWNNHVVIPSLREILVYPGAESWYLWEWAMRQHSLMTLRNCWKHSSQPWWNPSGPTYRGPLVFADLQTLITDAEGATELLPKSVVVDLIIQNILQPSSYSEYPIHVAHSHNSDYKPPFLFEVVRSNERTPLRRITLSGTVDGMLSVLRELQSRASLPPHVRMFFELEEENSERDLVRPCP
jgi:hypothetical protein